MPDMVCPVTCYAILLHWIIQRICLPMRHINTCLHKLTAILIPALISVSCGGGSSGGTALPGSGQLSPLAGQAQPVTASDDFERASLGSNWAVIFPPFFDSQVRILDNSDLGMDTGSQGFFLVNWRGNRFGPDQFSEATIPEDATSGWIYMVYVRWRKSDSARYGFAYNGDPSQSTFGSWIFKYDGVPTSDTRVIASTSASVVPGPGDTLRIEVEGFTLRGYLNGGLVLSATDTANNRIADGEAGLAARWATGNQPTNIPSKVWESWRGGDL